MQYIGIVHHDEGSAYGISFPDLPGCTSAADAFEDLPAMAEEAVAAWVEVLDERGDPRPAARPLEAVREHEDAAGALTFLPVRAPDSGRCVRINITLPEPLVQQIDAAVGPRRRSGFLAAAARAQLAAR